MTTTMTGRTLMEFEFDDGRDHVCSAHAGDFPPSHRWRQQDYRFGRPVCGAARWSGNAIVWLINNPDKTIDEYRPKRRNTPVHVCSDVPGALPVTQLWRDQDLKEGRPVCVAARWSTNCYAWTRNYPGRPIEEYKTNQEQWEQYAAESYHRCSDDPNAFEEDTARFYQQDRRRGQGVVCAAAAKSYVRYQVKVNKRWLSRLNGESSEM